MAWKYYAVHRGRETGVFPDWETCKQQTYQFRGSVFKGFNDYEQAEEFVQNGPEKKDGNHTRR